MTLKNEMAKALLSNAPDESLGEKSNLFGQFVGEWDFEWSGFDEGGTSQKVKGEWIFSWILEGRAIQDVWIIPTRSNRNKPGMPDGEYGTTVRFYSEEDDAWKVVWAGPSKNRLNTFLAKKIADEIVMEAINEKQYEMKWIFSEITDRSFRWRSLISKDGETWKLVQEMRVTRKSNL